MREAPRFHGKIAAYDDVMVGSNNPTTASDERTIIADLDNAAEPDS
jgi:hypothetical protein